MLYEVGGSYDTAGDEATAAGYYEAALAAGLSGDTLRKCLLQYGSTLRLLGRYEDSVSVLDRALAGWPDSPSVRAFHALGLHAAGRSDGAVGELLALVADAVRTPDILRYEAALHGNAGYLIGLDGQRAAGEPPPSGCRRSRIHRCPRCHRRGPFHHPRSFDVPSVVPTIAGMPNPAR